MKAWIISKNKARQTLSDTNHKILPSSILELNNEIKLPTISENEALIKIEAAGLNFNSVWSARCYPVDPFSLVNGHIRRNQNDKKHLQDYFIPGSDASGHIVKIGDNSKFKEGDQVIVHCAVISDEDLSLNDPMLSKSQSVWGYETNFGSFAEYSIVKTSQLIPKPKNINFNQAGSYMLTLGTAYRMLVSKNGGQLKKGETCLIWGASGGLGIFAIQLVKYLGGIPICVVSTREKVEYCKKFGAEHIICLEDLENKTFFDKENNFNNKMWYEFSKNIKKIAGKDKVDMVFEHIGRDTMALSFYLLRRGGRVVTCAATSGYLAQIDIRYVWMEMKKLIGSHFCNQNEATAASDLIASGDLVHNPSKILEFKDLPMGLDMISNRSSLGKIAIKIGE